MRKHRQELHGRRGAVFSVRVTDEERATLEGYQRAGHGPRALGSWMRWRALSAGPVLSPVVPELRAAGEVLPGQVLEVPGRVVPELEPGAVLPPPAERLILDLCGGSGAWSQPYREAGYRVELVTLPDDVRLYMPPAGVWGILAAPPCDQFSLARNGHSSPRDFLRGLEVVSACLRVVFVARPRWWALENPVGYLQQFLGTPRDVFEPCDFGEPWTKRTALWGEFALPVRGPFVEPLGGGPFCRVCDPAGLRRAWCSVAAHRAVTAAGFARAFFRANP